MIDFWYRQPIQSKEFKEGLKLERLFRLYILEADLKQQINAVRKEIERRKKS